jgi:phosphopantothenoylcysteine decarboxylase/phosphopantothenate--cysteine ligase
VKELSGRAEHICLEDIILVAPATLNTINKFAAGIADNPVTALLASALGKGTPIYLAPSMHETLYKNPIFQKNMQELSKYRVKIIQPRFDEGKAKIAKTDTIVNEIIGFVKNYEK